MTKTTLHIPTALLATINQASSAEKTRYYLGGIFFDHVNKTMVATDGHILLFSSLPQSEPLVLDHSFILPRETVENVLKLYGKLDTLSLNIVESEKDVFTYDLQGLAFVPIDGTYPDYKRIFPENVPQQVYSLPQIPVSAMQNIVDVCKTFKKHVKLRDFPRLCFYQTTVSDSGNISPLPFRITAHGGPQNIKGLILPLTSSAKQSVAWES